MWRTVVRSEERLPEPLRKRLAWGDLDTPGVVAILNGQDVRGDYRKSWSGHERDQVFYSRQGRAFSNLSGISGLDSPGDGRSLVWWDYDRDGWLDPAITELGEPALKLFHNELPDRAPAAAKAGNVLALRLWGGQRRSEPSRAWSSREAYGATIRLELPGGAIVRELHCGEGYNAQNSRTVLVGIGDAGQVARVQIRWPSGRTSVAQDVPAGTLLTLWENAGETPDGRGEQRESYLGALGPTVRAAQGFDP